MSRRLLSSLLLCLSLALLGVARAQDYQHLAPKTPPSDATPAAVPPSPVPKADGSKEIVVDKLRAVVFIDSKEKLSSPPVREEGVVTDGIPLLSAPDFPPVVAPYLGKPLSLASVQQLVKNVVLYCRAKDRPVVDVAVPEQEITSGVLKIVFIEAHAGKIEAKGNSWFSSQGLLADVRLRPGDTISANTLNSDIDWINRNPFVNSQITFHHGDEPGQSDVVLQAQDRFPVRFYTGYENNGNQLTGDDRYEAGFNLADPFRLGFGEQFSYQYTTSGDGESLVAHSASWVVPLPWRHTLTLFGALSTSHATSGTLDLRGAGDQAGLRYEIPLPGIAGLYKEAFTLGYDWKQSQNSLEFGSIPASASTTDIGQLAFAYSGTITDPWGVTSVNPQVYWSGDSTWGHQTHDLYNSVRAGASPDYAYLRLGASRLTRLPWNFTFSNAFQWQVSDGPLLPSEQLQFGGASSIRGYNEWDLSGTDEGWTLQNEFRFPPVSLVGRLEPKDWQKVANDQLQVLAFCDLGQAWAHRGQLTDNAGAAKDTIEMASVGPGLRYTVGNYLSFRADYGIQLRDTGDPDPNRWSLALTVSY